MLLPGVPHDGISGGVWKHRLYCDPGHLSTTGAAPAFAADRYAGMDPRMFYVWGNTRLAKAPYVPTKSSDL